jgi:hypothetical protein
MPALIYTDEWEQNGYAASHPEMIISSGCVVKLRNPLHESFFVIVEYRDGNTKWVGRVDNHLINGSEYNFGNLVHFTEEDVYDFKSLEVVEQQKKNQFLNLGLRLMVTYLEEIGIIREEMTPQARLEITDYFIMRYPEKLAAMLKLVYDLSTEEGNNEGDEGDEEQ